jgi:ABC-type transport system involved in multi-copper enzyme maturation permease subunit
MKILAIAGNTFREALRDKILLTLVVIAALVTAASKAIPPLAVGEGSKIVKDLGLATMTLFCVLIAVLVGGRLVYREIEKRTILTVLAKPIRRWEFLIGKYLGLMFVLVISVAVMTVWFALFLIVSHVAIDAMLLLPVLMLILELGMVTAVAIMFSTFVTPISSAVFTSAIYFAGNMSRDLLNLATQSWNKSLVVRWLAYFFYYLLPNFTNLDVRTAVIHNQMIDPVRIVWVAVYALLYIIAMLFLAILIFQRRNF